MRTTRKGFVLLGVAALVVAACGGSDDTSSGTDDSVASTTEAPATPEPDPTEPTQPTETTAAPEPGIDSFDQVQPAVIQIVAQGSFRDPEVGMVSGAGSGSGFVISADGLAVTNNHVVTGAATLEVFIGGDDTQGYNAQVVGVSECNDLALIDIDTDDALPFLAWSEGQPSVGTEVYTAGFPLGDPEFTMTRGIVAKAVADGETPWASIDRTIEHDASIQPGNSGGPLIGADGRVVGVNYATFTVTNQSQFLAIEASLAQDVVGELLDGDFESLGINGTAVADESSGLAGVWVAGTAPGSPSSNAGLLPGDIITSLNGLPIGTDGTMKDYCDVIRTAGDRPISVEILRFDTQEVLRGEINGELPLEQVISFADEIDDEVEVADSPGTTYSGYQTLIDDTGSLTVDVPIEWGSVDTEPFDGTPWIGASTDLDRFYSGSFDVPGMFMLGSTPIPDAEIAATIETFAPEAAACGADDGLAPYDDPAFAGQFRLWGDCGGVGAVNVIIVANEKSGGGAVVIGVQLVTEIDFDALDQIIATFNLAG